MNIVIINGPNLNLLGQREPEVYGSLSMEDILQGLKNDFPQVNFSYFQSNLEGELISKVQEFGFSRAQEIQAIIMNPGGYSHTSVALADAIGLCRVPVVEVHLSNIYARETYRHTSITGGKCVGVITGFGKLSYWLAVDYILKKK